MVNGWDIITRFLLFYNLSKLFWLFFQPLTIIFLLILIALPAFGRGYRRLGLSSLAFCVALVFLSAFTTFGSLLLEPLEDRFPKAGILPQHVDGIVVLGGYLNGEIDARRKGTELNSAADRILEAMRLARHFPDAKIVVSGGNGTFFEESVREADSTRILLSNMGFSGERFVFESNSRNAAENATLSKQLANPQSGETWLLVTSAYHMPRAVGCFRKAGFEVIAWPVDYKTRSHESFSLYLESPNEALSRFSVAIREWVGLAVYWITGKTDMLLPQP